MKKHKRKIGDEIVFYSFLKFTANTIPDKH